VFHTVADATGSVVEGVEATAHLVSHQVAKAAAHAPGLRSYVKTMVHSGFWEAYSCVRDFVHETLRKELIADPRHVYFTGHSLGGALATLAAFDCSVHTIPRVNTYFEHKR
jgi:poly(3-hydroxybutyrate) depolymerase